MDHTFYLIDYIIIILLQNTSLTVQNNFIVDAMTFFFFEINIVLLKMYEQ
jgi:hypothetical protein